MKAIEEKIEDTIKALLTNNNIKYYNKIEPINNEIDKALKTMPSKSGGIVS